jgi:hypothetical protein
MTQGIMQGMAWKLKITWQRHRFRQTQPYPYSATSGLMRARSHRPPAVSAPHCTMVYRAFGPGTSCGALQSRCSSTCSYAILGLAD